VAPDARARAVSVDDDLILIGLGANLPSGLGPPRTTLATALDTLGRDIGPVVRRSRFWRTRPVPDDGQPWFVNLVAAVDTALDAEALLARLLRMEVEFGRVRGARNAPRILDLDLLAFGQIVREGPIPPLLPHPRMARRAFVLRPLAEIAPGWRHPGTGETLDALLTRLPADQHAEPLD